MENLKSNFMIEKRESKKQATGELIACIFLIAMLLF